MKERERIIIERERHIKGLGLTIKRDKEVVETETMIRKITEMERQTCPGVGKRPM